MGRYLSISLWVTIGLGGLAYVEELRNLIRYNGLERADLVTLRKMRPILLVPVGEGVD